MTRNMKHIMRWSLILLWGCLGGFPLSAGSAPTVETVAEQRPAKAVGAQIPGEAAEEAAAAESWMGVYINGLKVGYSRTFEAKTMREGHEMVRFFSESQIRMSRLGGDPIELTTIQESWVDTEHRPLETIIRTKMSQTETVITARVTPETVVFSMGEKVVREIPARERFYIDVPLEEILAAQGLRAGASYTFKLLDPVAYALSECRFFIRGEEDILILGEKKRLWHVTTEVDSLIPMTLEEWMDAGGTVYKTVTQAGFLTTVALRMDREKALEASTDNFDIAFSSLIPSNVILPDPRQVRRLRLKLSGPDMSRLLDLPWDGRRQRMVEQGPDYVIVETVARIFREEDSPRLPLPEHGEQAALAATIFCQSDDTDIRRQSQEIVGEERNAWRAAKRIAEWISREMTPNYDVGFASAREIMRNREGDCSEHSVLFVALCRAAGIPARAAVGLMYGDGIFAYHMWPEVFVGEWVALDPKWLARDPDTREYFTDATHLKFGHSNLDADIFREMATAISEIIGKLKLEVLEPTSSLPKSDLPTDNLYHTDLSASILRAPVMLP